MGQRRKGFRMTPAETELAKAILDALDPEMVVTYALHAIVAEHRRQRGDVETLRALLDAIDRIRAEHAVEPAAGPN